MSSKTITRYVIEVAGDDHEVIDTAEVYADSLTNALAQAYTEVDSAYVEVYGPSVAEWMQVRLHNTDDDTRTKWYTVDALGEVEA